jgi:hypothetical protein
VRPPASVTASGPGRGGPGDCVKKKMEAARMVVPAQVRLSFFRFLNFYSIFF